MDDETPEAPSTGALVLSALVFYLLMTLVGLGLLSVQDLDVRETLLGDGANVGRDTLLGAGTGLGVVAGIAVTDQLGWIQARIEAITGIDTLPASVYQLSTLPSEVDPIQVAIVVGIAMVLSLGATLLPSRQGARVDPAEALRHE